MNRVARESLRKVKAIRSLYTTALTATASRSAILHQGASAATQLQPQVPLIDYECKFTLLLLLEILYLCSLKAFSCYCSLLRFFLFNADIDSLNGGFNSPVVNTTVPGPFSKVRHSTPVYHQSR